MTINNVIDRIKQICLAHNQVRSFQRGFEQDFLADKTRKFAAVFLEDNGGSISLSGKATTLSYRLSFWDLVNVSEDTKTNEQDVDSDMVSVAMDIIAQMNYGAFDDWAISLDNNLQLVFSEADGDMMGGCTVDISIRIMFKQNVCAVPSDLIFIPGASGPAASVVSPDLKFVYDLRYNATGSEGSTLTLPELSGKKVLFITRESSPIYKVSNNPDPAEYTFNGTDIGLGVAVNSGDRFLILYRTI